MNQKKQLGTTIILLLVIIVCTGSALYLRSRNQTTAAQSLSSPISQEIDTALRLFETNSVREKARLQTVAENQNGLKAELVFLGLTDEDSMSQLLSALQQSDIIASFYVTGADVTTYPQSLLQISNSNHFTGVAYAGNTNSSSATVGKRAIADIIRTSTTIQSITGIRPVQMLALTQPDDVFLTAASASSIKTVVVPSQVVPSVNNQTLPPVQELMDDLPHGSILCMKLGGIAQETVDYYSQFFSALKNTELPLQAQKLSESTITPVKEIQRIYTTERAVCFTFSGLGNQAELNGVLDALRSVGGTGTFFVARNDLSDRAEQVNQILSEGHTLGIAVQSAMFSTADALLQELLSAQDELRSKFAYTDDLPVRPSYGGYTDLLRQACGMGKFTLLSAMVNVVKAEDMRVTDPSVVFLERFPVSNGFLQRGAIIHFQMNQYQYSDTMLSELVKRVARERNMYDLKPAMAVVNNKEYTYTYPVAKSAMLPEVRDAIYPGQLKNRPIDAIVSRYIGIDWINSTSFLPGFTSQEVKRLDKKGTVAADQNVVFLTFDDWGTDESITRILDVLKAHNAKATFFIRTENMVYNPNLLRAITMEGHAIGSHTRKHLPLAIDTGSGRKFSELSTTQLEELEKDLVASYEDLQSVIGDIKIDGRPALTKLFRPPTLAVSKSGLAKVFDCGFTYSVSGSYTTQDYKAKSASSLADALKRYTKNGAILIMHMSDTSIYTADGLDMYLREMEMRLDDNAYRFLSLSEALK